MVNLLICRHECPVKVHTSHLSESCICSFGFRLSAGEMKEPTAVFGLRQQIQQGGLPLPRVC